MLLLNGERRHCVDASDRGFQYGDGLFETIEVWRGKPLFFDRHIKRLANGCRTLLIPLPDVSLLEREAVQLSSSAERAVLKLIVTRGTGGRGYRQPEPISPTRLLSLHPYPDYPNRFQADGVVARFCNWRLAANPALAGIKHLNRLEQVMARAEWQDNAIQEGLMLDYDDFVIEGTMSNLFLARNGVLYTPELSRCGINGIVREMIFQFAERMELPWLERQLDRQTLLDADEIFVTNSVIGIWPVRQLEQRAYGVGRITRSMQQAYATARLEAVKQ